MKHKIALPITVVLVMSMLVIVGLKTYHFGFAATAGTKVECSGNVITVSATAPSTVTTGSTVNITNVSSISVVPNGITVNKIVSTNSVVNATPSQVSGAWTGSGIGTFTAHFPDVSLTATGAAGSQIKLSLSSIDLYVNGGTTPVTCSVANGQLTANAAGESLTILSTGITAPAPPPTPPSSGGSGSTGGSTSSGTTSKTSPAPTANQTTTSAAPAKTTVKPAEAPTPAPAASTTQIAAVPAATVNEEISKQVTIVVKNSSAHTLANAKVLMDSLPPAYTNKMGVATFNNVATGNHKVTVWVKNKSAVRTFQLDDKTAGSLTLAVELPDQKLTSFYIAGTATGSVVAVSLIGLYLWLQRKRSSAFSATAASSTFEYPAPPDNVVVSPAGVPIVNTELSPPQPQPIPPVQQVVDPTVQPVQIVQPTQTVHPAQPVQPTQPEQPIPPDQSIRVG